MPNEPDPSDQRSEHEHARPPELRGKESEQSDSGNTVTHEHGRKTQVFRESAYSRFSGWWNRDRVLNPLTFLIFYTTVAYTVYSQRQWKTMQRQLDAFQTVEGASIGVGKYQSNLSDGEIGIPIENYGHIPSPKVSIFVHVYKSAGKNIPPFYSRNYTFGGDRTEIPPGSSKYGVTVPLELSVGEAGKINRGEEILTIFTVIRYDSGFGKETQPGFAFSYNPRHPDTWDQEPVVSFADLHPPTEEKPQK